MCVVEKHSPSLWWCVWATSAYAFRFSANFKGTKCCNRWPVEWIKCKKSYRRWFVCHMYIIFMYLSKGTIISEWGTIEIVALKLEK